MAGVGDIGGGGVAPHILHAWLTARSIARGLPLPIPEHGGFRVDTRSDAEAVRWVFPGMAPGIAAVARTIDRPRHFVKLCGTDDELRAVLPAGWVLHAPTYFMQATRAPPAGSLPDGYRVEVVQSGAVSEARIVATTGALAASGYAAGHADFFIYDRIVTAPDHRRKGLGHALMRALHDARPHADSTQLLVATEEGRALYSTLGWETISPYSTASIAEPE